MITVVKTPKRIFSGCHGLRRQTQVAQCKIDEGFQARFGVTRILLFWIELAII